jgi:hypothetical protein
LQKFHVENGAKSALWRLKIILIRFRPPYLFLLKNLILIAHLEAKEALKNVKISCKPNEIGYFQKNLKSDLPSCITNAILTLIKKSSILILLRKMIGITKKRECFRKFHFQHLCRFSAPKNAGSKNRMASKFIMASKLFFCTYKFRQYLPCFRFLCCVQMYYNKFYFIEEQLLVKSKMASVIQNVCLKFKVLKHDFGCNYLFVLKLKLKKVQNGG